MIKNKGLYYLSCFLVFSFGSMSPVFSAENNEPTDAVPVWIEPEESQDLINLIDSSEADIDAEVDETFSDSSNFNNLEDSPKDLTTPQKPGLTPRVTLEGVPAGKSLDVEDDYIDNSAERFLEPSLPPGPKERSPRLYLENKGMKHGFLTGYVTKRANIDLKLMTHPPDVVPPAASFQIANYGDFIRIAQMDTQLVIGYSKNYFGFRSVYLQKDYDNIKSFWSRFKIAPSTQPDWYLIRSMREPKKCLSVGWAQQLRLTRCNSNNKWQQWRFLKETSDAYWVPDLGVGLDIL